MAVETAAPEVEERTGLLEGAIQRPRVTEPHRLWSLLDLMRPFYPVHYSDLAAMISKTRLAGVPSKTPVQPDMADALTKSLTGQVTFCDEYGFKAAAVTLRKLLARLERGESITTGEVSKALEEFGGRLRDEMEATVFFSLTSAEGELYYHPDDGWEDIITRFPETEDDVFEAGTCMALARYTASVFHLVRVAESGLRALAISLDPTCDPSTLPSWDALLKRCDREIQAKRNDRSPEWLAKEAFYTDATAHFRAVCRAWRNTVAHVDQVYTEERARGIYNATKELMRHLSTEL